MTESALPHDPLWPRAGSWPTPGRARAHVGILGVPTHLTSLSPTGAHTTPAAVRGALNRYSTWSYAVDRDLTGLRAVDLGDVRQPDGPAGEVRTQEAVGSWTGDLLIAIGGDNSLTYPVAVGMGATGVVTLDAHHDLRDGSSNGSPIRRLLDAGLPGRRVVQVGLADFANSAAYVERARAAGITIITRDEVAESGIRAAMHRALTIAGVGPNPRIHVDLDVDVCDRSVAPACPASVPGGLSAYELRLAARAAGADPRVVSLDIAEVDATADSPDERTVRLAALCVLEAAAGVAVRSTASPDLPQLPANHTEREPGSLG
ncbi:MAG: arginase family protein [Actinobacteria bacterium]|nr:arginase family protein [Actinomycetota bacterium]MCB9413365.1 arginase family protein [Actinomycetota bacterium]